MFFIPVTREEKMALVARAAFLPTSPLLERIKKHLAETPDLAMAFDDDSYKAFVAYVREPLVPADFPEEFPFDEFMWISKCFDSLRKSISDPGFISETQVAINMTDSGGFLN